MNQFLTRQQIGDKLKALDSQANYLFFQYGEGEDLIREFAKLAQDITSNVGPNDFEWTHERIDVILESIGDDPAARNGGKQRVIDKSLTPLEPFVGKHPATGALSRVATALTENEIHTLRDVGSRVNHRLHDPGFYQSLLGRGLIVASLAGGWMCTPEGRQVIAELANPGL